MQATHNNKPRPLPKQAPVAIVGRKMPAGTIIPNAQAVKPILMRAVVMRRKIFSQIAFGL